MVAGLFVYIGIYRFFEIRQVIVHNVAQLKKQRTGSGTEGLVEEIPRKAEVDVERIDGVVGDEE